MDQAGTSGLYACLVTGQCDSFQSSRTDASPPTSSLPPGTLKARTGTIGEMTDYYTCWWRYELSSDSIENLTLPLSKSGTHDLTLALLR